ncbi:hypothetical protein J6590_017354 [Homalodisca vitripennis]|nr:hypothetical protein J6590_017354 [Homalodisca vitripennis]
MNLESYLSQPTIFLPVKMNKVENGYFIRSYKQWGNKPKCGCVEFSFDNVTWFASKTSLISVVVVTVFMLVLGCQFFDLKLGFYVICFSTVALLSLLVKILMCVQKETLHVIAPVGVQFITTYLIGKESVLFVPWHSLKNFVIVEMIVGQKIFFYLGLQNRMNSNNGLVILFQKTRPRLMHLEEMYRVIVEHSPGT